MKHDVTVLGAGIVGVSTALHLQTRGVSVALIDRRGAGEETSFGNAGVIERSAVFPVAFPRDIPLLLRVAFKQATQANYHFAALPRLLGWLWAYYRAGSPAALEATARALHPLLDRALAEHEALMAEAGISHLLRRTGWMKLYRSEKPFRDEQAELALADRLGVPYEVRDTEGARTLEPDLAPVFGHAVWWPSSASVPDPGSVVGAYAELFRSRGGTLLKGDARTLRRAAEGWTVETDAGPIATDSTVVALGPWAPEVLEPLGIRLPLAVKRGYHMHFGTGPGATLARPIVDVDGGYALAPMVRGLRLTTGVEFALRDAAPTPEQLDRCLPYLQSLVPRIGPAVDPTPWLGARPTLPDSLPAIGPAPRQPGLFLAFGHQHLGFTLGPVTGRLVAEMLCGEAPAVDPKPFRPDRFG